MRAFSWAGAGGYICVRVFVRSCVRVRACARVREWLCVREDGRPVWRAGKRVGLRTRGHAGVLDAHMRVTGMPHAGVRACVQACVLACMRSCWRGLYVKLGDMNKSSQLTPSPPKKTQHV